MYIFKIFIYLFTFGWAGSSLLRVDFLLFQGAGPTLSYGLLTGGFSCCGVRAPECGLSICGLFALWHVESSPTRDGIHVPCIGRWTTREVPSMCLFELWFSPGIAPGVGLLADVGVLFLGF